MLVMKKLKERVLSILEKGKRQKAKDMVMIGRREVWGESLRKRDFVEGI